MGADIRLPGTEDEATLLAAVVVVAEDHSASIQHAGDEYEVEVNGVALGALPMPLRHGDRVDVIGLELLFADEQQGTVTAPVPLAVPRTPTPAPARGTPARSGGRLISLVDGREYRISDTGTILGREAGCDIVVAFHDVSRRHARIEIGSAGYVVVDTSTNGVLVNGARIAERQTLGRGDILKVGPEEFRFHADPLFPDGPSLGAVAVPPPPLAPERLSSPAETSGVIQAVPIASASSSPTPALPRRIVLSTLEVINEGPTKGTRYELTLPLSHLGRGAHNDVVVNDESVSDSHAKVQRRETGWFVVDMDSTNGTYVAGQRVQGEAALVGNVDLRLGGVKLLFRPSGGSDVPHGTRVIVGLKAPEPRRVSDLPPERPKAPPLQEGPVQIGVPKWLVAGLVLLVLAILYLIGKSG